MKKWEDSRRPSVGITNVVWCPVRWSGGVRSTSSALRLPLLFSGVSKPDFSETERRPGSLAVRGVRGIRCGAGGAGVEIVGKAAEDGPAPPFCFEEEVEVDAIGVDCSLR